MSPLHDADSFVSHYAKLLPYSDVHELQKVLEMKSVRRAEQAPILERFRQKMLQNEQPAQDEEKKVERTEALKTTGDSVADSRLRKLEELVKRKA